MNKTFYFEYDMKTGELLERTKDEIDDLYPNYPAWANVSPDGKVAIYEKNYNLWYMTTEARAKPFFFSISNFNISTSNLRSLRNCIFHQWRARMRFLNAPSLQMPTLALKP